MRHDFRCMAYHEGEHRTKEEANERDLCNQVSILVWLDTIEHCLGLTATAFSMMDGTSQIVTSSLRNERC